MQLFENREIRWLRLAWLPGINPNMLTHSRWCRELDHPGKSAFQGQGKPRDEALSKLRRELTQVKKERVFLQEAAAFSRKCRYEIPPNRTLP